MRSATIYLSKKRVGGGGRGERERLTLLIVV